MIAARWRTTLCACAVAGVASAAVASGAVTRTSNTVFDRYGPATIKGAVYIGPNCGVLPPGKRHCPGGDASPYSTYVKITRVRDGRSWKVKSGEDGRFLLTPGPGEYRIHGQRQRDRALPPPSRHVTLGPHEEVDVILDYDNGMY